MRAFTLIVTGGRNYKDAGLVRMMLDRLCPDVLVVGDCKTGADLWARNWGAANAHRCKLLVYDADWDAAERMGNRNAAGPIRNAKMVYEHNDAILLAFPGDKGTNDCITKAHGYGLLVWRIEP